MILGKQIRIPSVPYYSAPRWIYEYADMTVVIAIYYSVFPYIRRALGG